MNGKSKAKAGDQKPKVPRPTPSSEPRSGTIHMGKCNTAQAKASVKLEHVIDLLDGTDDEDEDMEGPIPETSTTPQQTDETSTGGEDDEMTDTTQTNHLAGEPAAKK